MPNELRPIPDKLDRKRWVSYKEVYEDLPGKGQLPSDTFTQQRELTLFDDPRLRGRLLQWAGFSDKIISQVQSILENPLVPASKSLRTELEKTFNPFQKNFLKAMRIVALYEQPFASGGGNAVGGDPQVVTKEEVEAYAQDIVAHFPEKNCAQEMKGQMQVINGILGLLEYVATPVLRQTMEVGGSTYTILWDETIDSMPNRGGGLEKIAKVLCGATGSVEVTLDGKRMERAAKKFPDGTTYIVLSGREIESLNLPQGIHTLEILPSGASTGTGFQRIFTLFEPVKKEPPPPPPPEPVVVQQPVEPAPPPPQPDVPSVVKAPPPKEAPKPEETPIVLPPPGLELVTEETTGVKKVPPASITVSEKEKGKLPTIAEFKRVILTPSEYPLTAEYGIWPVNTRVLEECRELGQRGKYHIVYQRTGGCYPFAPRHYVIALWVEQEDSNLIKIEWRLVKHTTIEKGENKGKLTGPFAEVLNENLEKDGSLIMVKFNHGWWEYDREARKITYTLHTDPGGKAPVADGAVLAFPRKLLEEKWKIEGLNN